MRSIIHPLRSNRQFRAGVAVVEVALCLPFVFLLTFGAIELSSGLYHQMTFRAAVHECATHACDGPTTCDDVQAVAQNIMSQMGVTTYQIEIDEVTRTTNLSSVETAPITHFDIPASGSTTAGLDDVPRGTILRLRLTGTRPPMPGLSLVTKYLDTQIRAQCVFIKER